MNWINEINNVVNGTLISVLIVGLITLAFNSLLLHGIEKNIARLLNVWMIFRSVMIMLCIIAYIVICVTLSPIHATGSLT